MLRRSLATRAAALRSHTPVPHFSEKVARGPLPTDYYRHPRYVLAREKVMSSMWKEHLLFKPFVYGVAPVVGLGYWFQA